MDTLIRKIAGKFGEYISYSPLHIAFIPFSIFFFLFFPFLRSINEIFDSTSAAGAMQLYTPYNSQNELAKKRYFICNCVISVCGASCHLKNRGGAP